MPFLLNPTNHFNLIVSVACSGETDAGLHAGTVVLFGFEHHLWLAGMMAGAMYNGLLYQTRRLWPCVIAHATTNLMLGFHVLLTQEWQWW